MVKRHLQIAIGKFSSGHLSNGDRIKEDLDRQSLTLLGNTLLEKLRLRAVESASCLVGQVGALIPQLVDSELFKIDQDD